MNYPLPKGGASGGGIEESNMSIIIKDGIPYETKDVLIDTKILEDKKAQLELTIANMPKLKAKPDEETLEFYNSFVESRLANLPALQTALDDINAKLEEIATAVAIPKEI